MRASPLARRRRLFVEPLEGRDVPAGNVTATLAGGVLTLRGDDFGNEIEALTIAAGSVTIDPDVDTTVNGGALGAPVTLPGTATRLVAALKSGGDFLTIAPDTDFILPGGAVFDLGEGRNILTLSTTGKVQLGALAVRAGDGDDAVTVTGGTGDGSTIAAGATFDFGPGSARLTLGGDGSFGGELSIPGLGGVRVTMGEGAGGINSVSAFSLTVAKGVSVSSQHGNLTSIGLRGSTIGGLNVSGRHDPVVTLDATRVNGNVTVAGSTSTLAVQGEATAQVTVTGDVAVIGRGGTEVRLEGAGFRARNVRVAGGGGGATSFTATGQALTLTGGLTVFGGATTEVTVGTADPSQVAGDVTVTGLGAVKVSLSNAEFAARNVRVVAGGVSNANFTAIGQALTLTGGLAVSGAVNAAVRIRTADPSRVAGDVIVANVGIGSVFLEGAGLQARHVRVSSEILSDVDVSGQVLTLGGGVTVSSRESAELTVATTAVSEVVGNVTVNGGFRNGRLALSSTFRPGKNVILNLGSGSGTVTIGDGAAAVPIPGNLMITNGGGRAVVLLNRVAVAGLADIRLGAGNDTLTIENGSTFAQTFFANTGTGDDTISIAQNAGSVAPVTFTGTATIQAGIGNDTLRLGLAVAAGGDANSRTAFNGTGSLIDGGAGINSFDDERAQFTGLVLGTSITNWTDPAP